MTEFFGAAALIRQDDGDRVRWLSQWSFESERFDFIGGAIRSGESFRDCVTREVSQSLNLNGGKDFLVSSGPTAHLDFTGTSPVTGEETRYVVQLFDVQLFGASSRRQVDADPRNRWLNGLEIRNGRCHDGQAVSERLGEFFTRADLDEGHW